MERTLHEARRILGETGYTHDSWSTTMNSKDAKYNIGYKWVDNQVEVSIDLPDMNYSASSYDANICKIKNHTTGSRLHSLLIMESIVRFPNHIYNDDSNIIKVMYKGREYFLHTLAQFASNDARYAMIMTETGSVDKIPGIKSHIKHLLPVTEVSRICRVGIHDPRRKCYCRNPIQVSFETATSLPR